MTALPADVQVHRRTKDVSDHIALGVTKVLRFFADTVFNQRWGHRAVVLETVAAVPGMRLASRRPDAFVSRSSLSSGMGHSRTTLGSTMVKMKSMMNWMMTKAMAITSDRPWTTR